MCDFCDPVYGEKCDEFKLFGIIFDFILIIYFIIRKCLLVQNVCNEDGDRKQSGRRSLLKITQKT